MIRLRATLTGAKCRFGSNASPRRDAISASPVALVRTAPRRKSRRLMCNVVIFCCMTSFPKWLVPMAATLTQERFSGPEWIFERKYDGIRLLTFRDGDDLRLLSRNQLPHHHPAIEAAVMNLPVRSLILDGEVDWHAGTEYHVFDILWLDGKNVTQLALHERRALLATLPFVPPLQRVTELTGPRPWEHACAEGWEGVIAKHRDSQYEHRRS